LDWSVTVLSFAHKTFHEYFFSLHIADLFSVDPKKAKKWLNGALEESGVDGSHDRGVEPRRS
jgi:hypothetical protein